MAGQSSNWRTILETLSILVESTSPILMMIHQTRIQFWRLLMLIMIQIRQCQPPRVLHNITTYSVKVTPPPCLLGVRDFGSVSVVFVEFLHPVTRPAGIDNSHLVILNL